MNKKNQNKVKKLLIERTILIVCAAIICWSAFFAFGKHYRKKSIANANAAQKKAVAQVNTKKNKHHNSKKDKYKHQIASLVPGDWEPWRADNANTKKVAYLTFDDGPSINTTKILDILNANGIKATFFLIGQNAERNPNLVKLEIQNGESIGNHTYSHNIRYNESPDLFVADVNKCDSVLKSIAGDKYTPKLVRFPGGSFGKRLAPFRDAMKNNGYTFVDWNDENGDAEHPLVSVDGLMNNIKRYTGDQKTIVVLMHDAPAKTTTVQALPQIIQYLKSLGYSFDKIS
ncbi:MULTISPECIES: polysaccharide deacetylase family protein [Clostridium]|uniref:polysaccharide deacetylase family protein n=1 Tax=Clostridium TaxID=1485 RepID=UPI000826E181|nr:MULTISPECIES: polysaccharide deacetylase family protein [Clostridium]PJI08987.1 polysaccharide deacetylase [Clostridium sp. CT7]